MILTRIQSGAAQDPSGASLFTGSEPGFAVDPQAEQAYVVGGDGTVAQIDLSKMTVSYPYQPRTLAHAEKTLSGPIRQATWLGNGLLAITGSNGHAWLDANHNYQETSDTRRLDDLDTRTWTTRVIDPGTSTVTFANGCSSPRRAVGHNYEYVRYEGERKWPHRLHGHGFDGFPCPRDESSAEHSRGQRPCLRLAVPARWEGKCHNHSHRCDDRQRPSHGFAAAVSAVPANRVPLVTSQNGGKATAPQ